MTEEKTVYALGMFDGVHIGHGELLRACGEIAGETGCLPGAVTFATHPDALVLGQAPGLINTPQDRQMLMEELYGIRRVVTLPFDGRMREMPYRTFLAMLRHRYQAAGFVCGHDFRFGRRGEGTAALLQQACREEGIPCRVIPEVKLDGVTVSSTYIRTLLESGQMERAADFLGHAHVFSGIVVPGRHLGGRLGFPTANLVPPAGLAGLKRGVYACLARTVEGVFPAVTNVGVRPTVDGTGETVEAWLLDYDSQLYGKSLTLEFYKFLRPEEKFPSLEALKEEILKNARQTREFFQEKGKFSFTFGKTHDKIC